MDTEFTVKGAVVKEVIVTTLAWRGTGSQLGPHRPLTQVYEKDGTLIAEKDPWDLDKFVQGDLVNFARWCIKWEIKIPQYADVVNWLVDIGSLKPGKKQDQ